MKEPTLEEEIEIANFFLFDGAADYLRRYQAFMTLYAKVTYSQSSRTRIYQVDEPIISDHSSLRRLVQRLWDNPGITRREFQDTAFNHPNFSVEEFKYALRTVVQLAVMLDCTLKQDLSSTFHIVNYIPGQWNTEQTFSDFIAASLPKSDQCNFNPLEHRATLSAQYLRKRCQIKFEKTDNIADHLLYDRDTGILKIFHQTSYLQAQLQRKSGCISGDFAESGTLPRELILETLESFYRILFPIDINKEGRSRRLLRRLIKKRGFDPLAISDSHSASLPDNFRYVYWGSRLENLAKLAQRPPPTTSWMSWLEERTTERNALMIAILGLFLSVVFGLIGCLIGAGQLWLAILTWKYQS